MPDNNQSDAPKKFLRKLRRRQKEASEEYTKFAFKGNIVNLAIGVIIAGMFTAIVTSLNEDILTPLLTPLIKDINFSQLFIAMDGNTYATIEEAHAAGVATLNYGKFMTSVLNFFLISVVLFAMTRYANHTTKRINKIRKERLEKVKSQAQTDAPEVPEAPTTKQCPYCLSQIPAAATRCAFCTSHLPATDDPAADSSAADHSAAE
ncbi:MAG: large conductance mechanosensitive channel protein MscL [Eubacteriales bacterium]